MLSRSRFGHLGGTFFAVWRTNLFEKLQVSIYEDSSECGCSSWFGAAKLEQLQILHTYITKLSICEASRIHGPKLTWSQHSPSHVTSSRLYFKLLTFFRSKNHCLGHYGQLTTRTAWWWSSKCNFMAAAAPIKKFGRLGKFEQFFPLDCRSSLALMPAFLCM